MRMCVYMIETEKYDPLYDFYRNFATLLAKIVTIPPNELKTTEPHILT